MTEKRFTVHIRWYNYEKTEGEIELKDNGQPLLISESVEDVRYLKEMLNELHDENEQLKKDLKIVEEHRKQETEYTARLEEKNEQLKGEVAHYKLILMSLEQQAKRMSSIRRSEND